MRIISERRIRDFGKKHSDAIIALANWRRSVRAAKWNHEADLKAQFHDSDLGGEKTVFNIAKNRYRLVAFISFGTQIVYIKQILAHREYDKGCGNNEHRDSLNRRTIRHGRPPLWKAAGEVHPKGH